MLLIRCPYCQDDLPEAEFAYAGEAHIASSAVLGKRVALGLAEGALLG